MPKDYYTEIFKRLTGTAPKTTAATRQKNIERQMEGLKPIPINPEVGIDTSGDKRKKPKNG
jgi:hypothetical protein